MSDRLPGEDAPGAEVADRFPQLIDAGREFVARHASGPSLQAVDPRAGRRGGYLLSMFDEKRLRRILARMLDEEEFLGPYGLRSLSKVHDAHPYEFWVDGSPFRVAYAYFHGDNGAGLGATHQTGWTGLVAVFPHLFAVARPEDIAVRGLWGRPAGPADDPQGS